LAKRAVRFGHSCLVIPTEMSNRTWRRRWKQSVTGMTLNELAAQPKAYQQQRAQVFRRRSSVYLLDEEEKSMSVDALPAVVDEIQRRDGRRIDLILLDSADDLNPPSNASSGEKARYRDKIERSTAIYTWLKNYGKDANICIITTSQSRRDAEKKWWATSGTIGEDINKIRKAHVGISLNAKDSELNKGYLRIMLFKHTDGSVGAKCWVRNAYERGQFAYYSEPYVHEVYKEILKKEGILSNETS
jgi:replicative DNA helicase